ncbi:transposase InsO family protein [Actinopolymorpha pittospori]|uniref:Transposase InsO family protein n=1 Tax=Actinopolymorpha pittospori TaxID=648752 RepID=A0A927MQC2_9ACTN|nr:transposase InsO family protein [Actinopolymorpha pittospori]
MDSVEAEHGGVQPVLTALKGTPAEIAPSTYYAHKSRPPSARSVRDQILVEQIKEVHVKNLEVYGARKVWHEMRRQGHQVAKCTVERLMRAEGVRGVTRDKHPRTTKPAAETERPCDLVRRDFTASRPNQLWVADLTYVRTADGWVYVAFVLDVYSRMILGWQVSISLYTELALDALQMGIWRREHASQDVAGLVHHSDRGVQGGFQWSSQHLDEEVCGWGVRRDGRQLLREGRRCGRRVGQGATLARFSDGSGVRSGRDCRVRTRLSRAACRCRWDRAGFVRVAVCHRSVLPSRRVGICRSLSVRRSRC